MSVPNFACAVNLINPISCLPPELRYFGWIVNFCAVIICAPFAFLKTLPKATKSSSLRILFIKKYKTISSILITVSSGVRSHLTECSERQLKSIMDGWDFRHRNYDSFCYLNAASSWLEMEMLQDLVLMAWQRPLKYFDFKKSLGHLIRYKFKTIVDYDWWWR